MCVTQQWQQKKKKCKQICCYCSKSNDSHKHTYSITRFIKDEHTHLLSGDKHSNTRFITNEHTHFLVLTYLHMELVLIGSHSLSLLVTYRQ